MITTNYNTNLSLSDPNYVPVIKDNTVYYGGSQMWFSPQNKHSKDYILHNYGCGTIAAADLFLYLALRNELLRSPETDIAIDDSMSVQYRNYDAYVRYINDQYTKTRRYLAVLGPKLAWAINSYSKAYSLGYRASWKMTLGYYDMYELISEMLYHDIPVILSIGPNTPKLWGKKGIDFYQRKEVVKPIPSPSSDGAIPLPGTENKTNAHTVVQYELQPIVKAINGHYVTVTGLIKDEYAGRILLSISSWGKKYYIDYEEYRDYVDNIGGTITSSLVYMKKIY